MKAKPNLTPNVIEAVKSWITSTEMASYGPNDVLDAAWHNSYSAECELFNKHFKSFTTEESEAYREFVEWLDNTRMWESNLSITKLFEVFLRFY